jgi:hypothetical protein
VLEDTFQFEFEAEDLERIRIDTAFMISRRGWPIGTTLELDPEKRLLTARVAHTGGSLPSAALILQIDLPEIGQLKLRTTLLQPREEPYELMLELARERIRHFLQKCEDWHMFSPSIAPDAKTRFDCAREHLAAAVLEGDRAKKVALARSAIVAAVQAGEVLAATYADIILHRRFATSAASATSLGIRVNPREEPPPTDIPGLREFGVLMIETPWNLLQPEEGQFDFSFVDRWIEWAVRRRLPVVMGPLVDLREDTVPQWASIYAEDYELLCKLLWEHQEQVVSRYANHVAIWSVASGINVNRLVKLDNDQMIDLTRRTAVLVRQAHRNAKVLVELVHPFDDQVAACTESVPGYEYAARTLDEGVHVDCFGLVIECGLPTNGCEVRDLLSLSDAIDHFGRLERPLLITGLRVPSADIGEGAGRWHCSWSQDRQAQWATSMFGIAMGKMTNRGDTARARAVGVVEGVLWSGLEDVSEGQETGLLDTSCAPRKVMTQLATVRHALRRPLRNAKVNASMLSLDPEGITE